MIVNEQHVEQEIFNSSRDFEGESSEGNILTSIGWIDIWFRYLRCPDVKSYKLW